MGAWGRPWTDTIGTISVHLHVGIFVDKSSFPPFSGGFRLRNGLLSGWIGNVIRSDDRLPVAVGQGSIVVAHQRAVPSSRRDLTDQRSDHAGQLGLEPVTFKFNAVAIHVGGETGLWRAFGKNVILWRVETPAASFIVERTFKPVLFDADSGDLEQVDDRAGETTSLKFIAIGIDLKREPSVGFGHLSAFRRVQAAFHPTGAWGRPGSGPAHEKLEEGWQQDRRELADRHRYDQCEKSEFHYGNEHGSSFR